MIDIALKLSRTMIAAAALATLTACTGGTSSADLSPAAPQQAAPVATPAPAPPKVASSPEDIKAQCWMKYEGDKKIKNIDERLKIVEKCIDETSRNQPPPPRQ